MGVLPGFGCAEQALVLRIRGAVSPERLDMRPDLVWTRCVERRIMGNDAWVFPRSGPSVTLDAAPGCCISTQKNRTPAYNERYKHLECPACGMDGTEQVGDVVFCQTQHCERQDAGCL